MAAAAPLGAFVAAGLVLAVTPGPGVLFIVARTLAHGRAVGLASVAGVAAGNGGNALAASLGVAALAAAWPPAFDLLRWAGAAYLLWLAVQALRAPAATAGDAGSAMPLGRAAAFRQGAAVALLNPKTALFFAAFLPPFIDPAGPAVPQSLGLGALFVAMAAATDAGYALAASAGASAMGGLGRAARFGRYAVAAVYALLALGTLLSGFGGTAAPAGA